MHAGREQPVLHPAKAPVAFLHSPGIGCKGNHVHRTSMLAGPTADTQGSVRKHKTLFDIKTTGGTYRRAGSTVDTVKELHHDFFCGFGCANPAQRLLLLRRADIILIQTSHLTGLTSGAFGSVEIEFHAQPSFSMRQRMQR